MAGAPPPFLTTSSLPVRGHASQASFSTITTSNHSAHPSITSPPPKPTSTAPHQRLPTTRRTIYDRNLNRSRSAELSRPAFAYLFMEMVSYAQKRITSIADLEKRLNEQGYMLGSKCLDLLLYRSTPAGQSSSTTSSSSGGSGGSSSSTKDTALPLRPLRLLPLLNLIAQRLYPMLCGRPVDEMQQSTSNSNEYMIIDNTPITNQYISVPKEMSSLSVASYIAGVLEGVCDASGFACKVSAHNAADEKGMWPGRTVFLLKFDDGVGERERELERMGVK